AGPPLRSRGGDMARPSWKWARVGSSVGLELPDSEGSLERLSQRAGLDRFGICDQEDVDEIFRPHARPLRGAVSARVGVHLLCDVLRKGYGRKLDGLDSGK